MGFEMDQETVGSVPVCRFSFQMNFDSVVFCSYFRLLKDDLCCEYRCFHGPSVSPMYESTAKHPHHYTMQLPK